ncbi:MAG TPA: hypothetical protein PLX09_02610 [Xanthomonadaceae bacterium]|nr:hypothetical protein [Xanthomonadaceae bacterium]
MHTPSAEQWNGRHPVGTPVRVALVDGTTFVSRTGSLARQWGALAILTLDGRDGYWTTEALEPVDLLPADAAPVDSTGHPSSVEEAAS